MGRGRRGSRRAAAGRDPATFAGAFLRLLVRALDAERAVLLLEERLGEPLVRVASVGSVDLPVIRRGDVPGGGPWSIVLPLEGERGTNALVLLARAGGAPLPPADRVFVERLGDACLQLLEHRRVAEDLVDSRELLARADRLAALGTLAASIAHEIRNPLVSVRTFIQLLPERLADEEFRTTFRALALGEVERITSLITDLLAFTRPAPAQLEPADLNELVGQIVRLLDAEARRSDVELATETDPALPLVAVDDAQVKQVLMNVILNAIQACPAHGHVTVATRRDRTSCVVTVADSGPGIPPEQCERVFEPFYSTKEAGSGLGLFVARQIVTEHGGEITIAPRPGGGAVFSIHFPMRARARDADASAG
ncbi:MAG TPA: ATP-binding protein [Candidatus Binatia bacterium]|nr:ATP-binding protein [Candidatus Binatia bacterium]